MRADASAPVRRFLAIETAVSTLVNVALAGLVTTLMFGGAELALWGPGGLAFDFLPATFLPVFGMTAGLTWVTRKRRRQGKAPSIAAPPLAVPTHPLTRAILFAVVATVILGGLGLGLLAAIWSPELPFAGLLTFKLAYGAVIGLVVTPLILIATLRDPLPAAVDPEPA